VIVDRKRDEGQDEIAIMKAKKGKTWAWFVIVEGEAKGKDELAVMESQRGELSVWRILEMSKRWQIREE
jgi:hypothetical protein